MAYNQSITIPAHPNIYNGSNERTYRIEYTIPQKGTNEDTGIILLIPGFGGNIDSNVYKKMREVFADEYNLVTVQCDYFGSKFMQSSDRISYSPSSLENVLPREQLEILKANPNKLYEFLSECTVQVTCKASINETENEFADMSFMQAIDNITALEAVKLILNENNLKFNIDRVIGYGHSQGAYLLHLINKLAPHLFTYVIDNSSWVNPVYLYDNRCLYQSIGKSIISIEFEYFAKTYLKDKKALSLHNLYSDFDNNAFIYSILGTTDNLVDVQDKKNVFSKLKNVKFELIDSKKVDGEIFKSTNHGLDADFLKMFDYAMRLVPKHKNKNEFIEKYIVTSSQSKILVDYTSELPLFQFIN